MLEVRDLRKVYRGGKVAVDGISFKVSPGSVTGFLGPNGAGKTTTMRALAGLEQPTSGQALVEGCPFAAHPSPMSALGVLLEAKAVHPGRSVRRHLQALAATCGIPDHQVEDVLQLVGLTQSAGQRIRSLSLGMGQRVGLATALLGNPASVMLDEPLNGLDPEGVLWMRRLVRRLADQGRAVLISSHLMSEMALSADHLVVIGQGRLLADESMQTFLQRASAQSLVVTSPDVEGLVDLLREQAAAAARVGSQLTVTSLDRGRFQVVGIPPEQLGEAVARRKLRIHELTPVRASLEDVFMELTREQTQYRAQTLEVPILADV